MVPLTPYNHRLIIDVFFCRQGTESPVLPALSSSKGTKPTNADMQERKECKMKGCLTNAKEFSGQIYEQLTGLSLLQTHPNSRITLTSRLITP